MKTGCLVFFLAALAVIFYLYFTTQIIYIPYAKMANGELVKVFDKGNSERNLMMAKELTKHGIEFRYIDGEQITIPRYLETTGKIKELEEQAGVYTIQSKKQKK